MSFLRLVSRGFPGLETTFEIVELRKSELTHLVAGPCTAHPGAAVHEVSLVLLELCNSLRKIRRVHVDVDCSRNVACFKLLLGAHVEHDVLLVRPEFFKLGNIDVLEPLSLFLFRGGLLFVLGIRGARDASDAETQEEGDYCLVRFHSSIFRNLSGLFPKQIIKFWNKSGLQSFKYTEPPALATILMKAARHGNISIGGLVLGVSLTGGSKTEMQLGGRLPKEHFQFGNRQRRGGPAFVTEPCARPSEFQDVCGSGQISQRNPDRPLCISSSALGYKIGLGISPGCPARVSGWRVSVTICVCAGTRHDSRRLAAEAILPGGSQCLFHCETRVKLEPATCSDASGHWTTPSSISNSAGI